MERFIQNPNLPRSKVSMGIIDGRADKHIISKLNEAGINVLRTDTCKDLYDAVSFHPDMFLHHIGGNLIVVPPNAPETTLNKLSDEGFNIIKGEKYISRKYPADTAYNVARIGNYAVCSVKNTDRVLLQNLQDAGVAIIDVKQGYAKCSVCIAGENACITSDGGIYGALSRYGFDVLLVSPGFISLHELNYGFIGGASGLISDDTILFSGNIEAHPDFIKIESFLKKHNKRICCIDKLYMTDVGSFIPLKEYC